MVVVVLLLLLFLLYRYQRWSQANSHQQPAYQLLPPPQQLPAPISTWQCQVDGGAFVDFSAAISSTLETQLMSYLNGGSPTATFNRDGIPYKADFRTMEQQRDDGLYVTKRVIRRQALRPPLQHIARLEAASAHPPPGLTPQVKRLQAVRLEALRERKTNRVPLRPTQSPHAVVLGEALLPLLPLTAFPSSQVPSRFLIAS